jgi:hypothetical protein
MASRTSLQEINNDRNILFLGKKRCKLAKETDHLENRARQKLSTCFLMTINTSLQELQCRITLSPTNGFFFTERS